MFNPQEALERIRRRKFEKEQVQHFTQGVQPLFSNPPATKDYEPQHSNIEDRVCKLEIMISRLNDELSNSNQTAQKLKRENSNLETQILKLQYENSQLKANQLYSTIRKSNSNKKITESITQQHEYQPYIEKQKPKKQATPIPVQRQQYQIQVEQIIEDIKNQPIQNVLKRRQQQFRARKPDQKQLNLGNKYLRQLATLEKQYSKSMRKPVLVIKLDNADFQ